MVEILDPVAYAAAATHVHADDDDDDNCLHIPHDVEQQQTRQKCVLPAGREKRARRRRRRRSHVQLLLPPPLLDSAAGKRKRPDGRTDGRTKWCAVSVSQSVGNEQ
jgi:hypothetical protein